MWPVDPYPRFEYLMPWKAGIFVLRWARITNPLTVAGMRAQVVARPSTLGFWGQRQQTFGLECQHIVRFPTASGAILFRPFGRGQGNRLVAASTRTARVRRWDCRQVGLKFVYFWICHVTWGYSSVAGAPWLVGWFPVLRALQVRKPRSICLRSGGICDDISLVGFDFWDAATVEIWIGPCLMITVIKKIGKFIFISHKCIWCAISSGFLKL